MKLIEKQFIKKGCGALFQKGSGIIICGQKRADGNLFFCHHCLNLIKKLKGNNG